MSQTTNTSAHDVQWVEIIVETTKEQLEETKEQLARGGMFTFAEEEEEEFLQFLEDNRHQWDFVDDQLLEDMKGVARVKFYVTDNEDGRKELEEYCKYLTSPYTKTVLQENDWVYSWQKYYTPISIGERLHIVPEWMRDDPVPEGRVPFYLNPGVTFGTGAHASTQLCLESVEAHTKTGDTILDLGCGSGILSIASLVLGAKSAYALDIDPLAVNVAYENAALNQIGKDRYTVLAGNVLEDETLVETISQQTYPLIFANIVADVIIPLAPLAKKLLAPEGVFLCSGIIDTRAQDVIDALESCGFALLHKREKKGWVALEWQHAPQG